MGIPDWNLAIPVRKEGFEVLGTPIQSDSFVEEACLGRVEMEDSLLSKLRRLGDEQTALLVRYCDVPRITHPLRTVSPHVVSAAAEHRDKKIIEEFQNTVSFSNFN